jgi:hypothetical protein
MSTPIHRPNLITIKNAIKAKDQEYLSKYKDIIDVYRSLGPIENVNYYHNCGKPNYINSKIDDAAYKIIFEKNMIDPNSIIDSTTTNAFHEEITKDCADASVNQAIHYINEDPSKAEKCKEMMDNGAPFFAAATCAVTDVEYNKDNYTDSSLDDCMFGCDWIQIKNIT